VEVLEDALLVAEVEVYSIDEVLEVFVFVSSEGFVAVVTGREGHSGVESCFPSSVIDVVWCSFRKSRYVRLFIGGQFFEALSGVVYVIRVFVKGVDALEM
jgi:hypothetical protein